MPHCIVLGQRGKFSLCVSYLILFLRSRLISNTEDFFPHYFSLESLGQLCIATPVSDSNMHADRQKNDVYQYLTVRENVTITRQF